MEQQVRVNQIALFVYNLQKSIAFYKDVMGLKQVAEPFKDNKHSWFEIGPGIRLHLIEGAIEMREYHLNTHYAFTVKVLKEFTDNLYKLNIKYRNLRDIQKNQI